MAWVLEIQLNLGRECKNSVSGIRLQSLIPLCVIVKRDIQDSDEEAVRVKEQSILELGGLLAKTGQAAGNAT